MSDDPVDVTDKMCGRIDVHEGHHWRGRSQPVYGDGLYDQTRWVRPWYWCRGDQVVEGAQRARQTTHDMKD